MQEIALDDVDVVERLEVEPRGLDGDAQVQRHHLVSAVRSRIVRMTSDSAARVEHALSLEELRPDRMEPIQKLRFELGMHLDEVLPLPAECRRGLALLILEVLRNEARDSVADRPAMVAADADQLACLHVPRRLVALQDEGIGGDGAAEVLEECALHAAPRSSTRALSKRFGRSSQRRCQSWKTKSVQSGFRWSLRPLMCSET